VAEFTAPGSDFVHSVERLAARGRRADLRIGAEIPHDGGFG